MKRKSFAQLAMAFAVGGLFVPFIRAGREEKEEPISVAATVERPARGEEGEAVWLIICAHGPIKRRLFTQLASAVEAHSQAEEEEPISAALAVIHPLSPESDVGVPDALQRLSM
jgi:hypothetical protein